jgi:hypothetical protein
MLLTDYNNSSRCERLVQREGLAAGHTMVHSVSGTAVHHAAWSSDRTGAVARNMTSRDMTSWQ